MNMSKTRRNAPCPCDSGHKYKHCCGATSDAMRRVPKKMSLDEFPPDVQKQLIEAQRKMAEEQRIYGHARPMLTVEHMGYRFVVVHNRLEHSKSWKTPADFFDDYIKRVMDGSGWGNAEIAKPYEKRHPLLQWYHDVCTWQREHHHERNAEGVFGGVATGSVKAYYSVGYDLWTLDNHVLLQEILIRRLKIADQFQGARYEMYVIAAMIRAGFNVVLEDEKDPSRTHCELTATHRHT
ncbi:MAG: SEC-C domain-containing protein, partial [Rhodospirillales bacterium]|nr:SEC-C domain-containing protein [Rhodospirillales bacterium]